jgi:DNA (cytosine-5)-methyltransferase 1
MSRPRLLDLFAGAGGCAVGYHRAGFDVTGVDLEPQPRYPFRFYRDEARRTLEYLTATGGINLFAAIHASPPCQAHSDLQKQSKRDYPDFIVPVRELLQKTGLPYVIENVEGAPLIDPVQLCGANDNFFPDVNVIRHRLFESNIPLEGVPCPDKHPLVFTHDKRKAHYGQLDQDTSYVQVTGGGNATIANKRRAMDMPWASARGCNEAIPPAYTHFIGTQLMAHIAANNLERAA